MSRQHGTKAALFLDDSSNACKNISGDVTSVTFNALKSRPDTTTMGVDDIRRELDGVRDGTFDISLIYSHGAGACPTEMLQEMHAGSDYRRIQYFPAYNTSNSPYITACAFLNSYNINSPVDGIAAMNATFELASNRVLTPDVYAAKVLNTSSGCLIGYWPMWDVSGTTADNYEGTIARDGTYAVPGLGQTGIGDGRTSASFDGSTAYCDIFSSSLCTVFSGAEGTLMAWAKVSASEVWADGTPRVMVNLYIDVNNEISFSRGTSNDTIRLLYKAGGTLELVDYGSLSGTNFHCFVMTWSKTGEIVRYFYDGIPTGAADENLGIWAGDLVNTTTVIGAYSTTPTNVWDGSIAHVAIWKTPLTAAQILNLASV
jgi:hypothetical protein